MMRRWKLRYHEIVGRKSNKLCLNVSMTLGAPDERLFWKISTVAADIGTAV